MTFDFRQVNPGSSPLYCSIFSAGQGYLDKDPSKNQVFGSAVAILCIKYNSLSDLCLIEKYDMSPVINTV